MRTELQCEQFNMDIKSTILQGCKKCGGQSLSCKCRTEYRLLTQAYEACIPKDFWRTKVKDVTHNVSAFKQGVRPYCRNIMKARKHGYGVILLGDNGVGKTMFISYILMEAIRHGLTAYYTSMLHLEHNLKRGFNDRKLTERLEWMLTSDIISVDEMGKEKFKSGDSWMRVEIERVLKDRFDNSMPVLIATNVDLASLEHIYGVTITSIITGKYKQILMEPGDFREKMANKMHKDMGYK